MIPEQNRPRLSQYTGLESPSSHAQTKTGGTAAGRAHIHLDDEELHLFSNEMRSERPFGLKNNYT